jgi:hypothetical protein
MSQRFNFRPYVRAAAFVILTLFATESAFAANSIGGTSTAELVSDGSRAGMWKYTIQFDWASETPVFQLTFDLGLPACPCVCTDVFEFDFPSGSSPGNGGDCTAYLNARFSCDGDSFVGLTTPAVHWWPYISTCRPVGSGIGQVVMYSVLQPKTVTSPADNFYLRSGSGFARGKLSGQVPSCHGCSNVSV